MNKSFSVIIPTLNRPDVLKETIESILRQKQTPLEIIIIDQSDNEDTELICKNYSQVVYHHTTLKSGTHSRNIGIDYSKSDILVFLDDDVELLPGYFYNIILSFMNNKELAGVQGWIVNKKKRSKIDNLLRTIFLFEHDAKKMKILPNFLGTTLTNIPLKPTQVEWMPGCNFAVRKKFVEIERFDENLIKYALAEDRDLSYRILKYGDIYLNPKSKIIHKEVSISRLPSKKKLYMIAVHQLYLIFKHFGNSKISIFAYWWNMVGRTIYNTILCVKSPRSYFEQLQNTFSSFLYVINNYSSIKHGDLGFFHSFLNE
jgi:GT2 family glycosyltransferase